jgi:hypothetical protein
MKFPIQKYISMAALCAQIAIAYAQNASPFALGVEKLRSFSAGGKQYIYSVAPYAVPPVSVALFPTSELSATYESPESTLLSFLAGARAGNINWSQTAWASDSRLQNEKNWRDFNIDQSRILALWRSWDFSTVTLDARLTYGSYVLIEYSIKSTDGTVEQSTLVFERESNKWKLSHAIADDPVACCWKTAGTRPRRN